MGRLIVVRGPSGAGKTTLCTEVLERELGVVKLLTTTNRPMRPDDRLGVTGIFAVEIYNHGSEQTDATGLATAHWDLMLRRGRRVYGIATDDNSNGVPFDSPYSGSFGGWIVVDAPDLTRQALAASLRRGNFYSSTGPEVYGYRVDGHEVTVECSPVRRFITYERHGSVATAEGTASLTSASHTLGNELFVRVECIDASGRLAWTDPVFLEDLG